MEPIAAGGLVLGMTVTGLLFVGLCNAVANKVYQVFFTARDQDVPEPIVLRDRTPERRSA